MRFVGIDTREAVEALRGTVLRVPRDEVPLDPDAFWSDDLLGREVTDDDGSLVGVVEATLDGAAHDYLVIARPDGGEVMVPAVAELVEVGPDRIVVHAVPGLLDDDAW
jgi:16S rRNA processing protein RimM